MASFVLGACAVLSPAPTSTPLSATETAQPEIPPTEASAPQGETILLWLAPAFEPQMPAGQLLSARLAAFEAENPNVRISIRIKPVSGQGGLMAALEAAAVAAPASVPDLLTLAAGDLQHAAETGVIMPFPEDLIQTEDDGWYDFALPPSRYEGVSYGLPFAGEVEVLAYRKDQYPDPPRSWETILAEPRTLIFPAADPRARFILALYLGSGGELTDENGQPALDVTVVEQVLTFLANARSSSVLPLAIRQYTSPLETWTELKANRSASAMAPMADFLREGDSQTMAAVALPTRTGQGIGLAHTWSWTMTESDPQRQELILDLAAWLSEPAFAGTLTSALGYLPTSQAVLSAWPEDGAVALASSLVTITKTEPDQRLQDAINPALIAAVEAVLSLGEEPAFAAQAAVNQVNNR